MMMQYYYILLLHSVRYNLKSFDPWQKLNN